MNSFTNTVLTLMLGWLRTLLNVARDFVSSDSSTAFFDFFRNNWRILFVVLCVVGFALDKIIYLIRWRPRPVWLHRRRQEYPAFEPPEEPDETPAYTPDDYAQPTLQYARSAASPAGNTAPTMQYQMPQSRDYDTHPANLPFTTPYFAPGAQQPAYAESETALHWDETTQGHTFAPPQQAAVQTGRQQSFAFGMAPSFGSAQSEPAPSYHYTNQAEPTFAPPQYAPEGYPNEPVAPPMIDDPMADAFPPESQPPFAGPSPYFRPFSDREPETFAPPKSRGLGAVARRARNLLGSDEEGGAVSYQDLQPTVDVSKAFHSPVYPEKKHEEDS